MTKSALIIGAGLAGLSAAWYLHRAGWRTTVLEARDRVGGRVRTFRQGLANGHCAEAGAEYIDALHTRMLTLAHTLGLTLDPINATPGKSFLAWAGHIGPESDGTLWGVDIAAETHQAMQAWAELGRRVPDPTRPHTAPQAATLDAQSAADWLNALPLSPAVRVLFQARLRAEFTVEPDHLSLLDLARWGAFYYADPDAERETFRVAGGNDQIPRALAAALPDVRLNSPVHTLEQDTSGIHVHTPHETLSATVAVLAVPLSVARAFTFVPALPAAHQAALNTLQYGVVTKVAVQCHAPIWETHGWNGNLTGDLPVSEVWNASGAQAGAAILMAYTGGQRGAEFSALDDATRTARALADMERACPGLTDHVQAARTQAWANEPFTRGAYAAYAPGQVTAFWPVLRQPVGRLYFAGEHTADHQGYMEGAVESGERAASAIQGDWA